MEPDRTKILNDLFVNAETFMAELASGDDTFTNLKLLRKAAQDQQEADMDLLNSFRDRQNRSPFNAVHQEIVKRIYNVALAAGYVRARDLDEMGADIFGNPTKAKYYRRARA